jgi:hypothetical protein
MNQHTPLPPSNVLEIAVAPLKSTEQFIVLRGSKEPWIDGDLFTRAQVIKEIDADYSNLAQVIALSLEAGTSRDATDEICSVVIERWAQDGETLSREARDFVAMCKGEAFANCFRLEEVA